VALVIVDLEATTTNAVNKKLDGLREEGGAFTMARVLTLVIAPDSEAMLEESIEAANAASREPTATPPTPSWTPRSASATTPVPARWWCSSCPGRWPRRPAAW
jgi:hypothetical protein